MNGFSGLGNIKTGDIVIILVILAAVVGIWWLRKILQQRQQHNFEKVVKETTTKEPECPPVTSELGTGEFDAYALKDGKLFPTKIPRPIGDLFMFDQTMPKSGYHYWVIETEIKPAVSDGPGAAANVCSLFKLEAYNPLRKPFQAGRTPEDAYDAVHWPEVKDVWVPESAWWQNVPMWMAIAILVIDTLGIFIVFGG